MKVLTHNHISTAGKGVLLKRIIMEPSDLNICRSVRYTKGWRKGAVKCTQCGFWFVSDSQKYPLADSEPMEYLTGIEWFAQFKCCPNCQPAEPTAPFGKRRCLGHDSKFHHWFRGCGIWYVVCKSQQYGEKCRQRLKMCHTCKTRKPVSADKMTRYAMEQVRTMAQRLQRSPTQQEWRESNNLSMTSINLYFGGWNQFLNCAGLPTRKAHAAMSHLPKGYRQVFSNQDILGTIKDACVKHGHVISQTEWERAKLVPNLSTIRDRFVTWNNAVTLAGFSPNPSARDLPIEQQRASINHARMFKNSPVPSPTAREMWQFAHGEASESTKRYLDAMDYHAEKLAEQERIFKEHQFKSKDDIDSSGES